LLASVSTEGATTVVSFIGEADLFTLPVVVDTLSRVMADHDGLIVVDLAQADFVDTGTVRAFARASEFLADRGRQLTLRSPSPLAVRLLTFSGLAYLIEADR
jgi:anti-anti-sigma factor